MSTPTIKTLAPVTYQSIGVVTGFLLIPRGSGQANVYNGDINNVLYVSQNPTPVPGNSIPIQPLTNATLDGSTALYASAAPGLPVANVTVSASSQISPSPAQIAQQIAGLGLATLAQQITQQTAIPNNISTTGVPAVLSSLVGTIGPIASGSAWGPTVLTFTTGGAYEITFLPTVAGNVCISDVQITHLDSSGSTTYVERYTISTAGGIGNLGCIIRGNLYGNRLSIQGTTGTQAQVNVIFASSPTVTGFSANVYSRPFVETSVPKMLPIAFDGALVATSSTAIGASSTVTLGVLQPYSGKAIMSIQSQNGGGFNLAPFIKSFTVATQPYTIWTPQTGGATVASINEVALDQRIHLLQVLNLAAAAGNAGCNITAEQYI
jgi:hypothetical protein